MKKITDKQLDEIIELFCSVTDNDIWGKDTELYATDADGSALEKARKEIREILE